LVAFTILPKTPSNKKGLGVYICAIVAGKQLFITKKSVAPKGATQRNHV